MSKYYNPNRSSNWNYGGENWKLSRSKIDLFIECPRCFYIDNKLGTKRPPGYPHNLNSAVDALLKKEFDAHRVKDEQHALQKEYGIDAKPAVHEKLDSWRDWKQGVMVKHEPTELTVSGAIDDLWINESDEYVVVDYKATAKDGEVSLDADWQGAYKRQMEIYQWLLRQNALDVSDTGYFVYCNGITDKEAFDGQLEFEISVLDYVGNDDWIEDTLADIKQCLEADVVPAPEEDCDYCQYRDTVRAKLTKAGDGGGEQSTLF